MNRLPLEKRTQIINMLVEGSSLRATSRVCDVSINTVTKLLVDVGDACLQFHDEMVRGVVANKVQCDEIWSFVYAKQKNVPDGKDGEAGDIWTWTGIDADTKLIITWFVGQRDAQSACEFMQDISDRTVNRMQLTSDGHRSYLYAVDEVFGSAIDFAQLVKLYGKPEGAENERRYSPSVCTGAKKQTVSGSPDERYISTSYVERQNLTMRMSMRRFTRLTNAFSKKIDNHCYAIALHFVYYNFCRIHKTLRATPAMAAGLVTEPMKISDVIQLAEKYSN